MKLLAPALSSARTVSVFPFDAAKCSAVWPELLVIFGSAPLERKNVAMVSGSAVEDVVFVVVVVFASDPEAAIEELGIEEAIISGVQPAPSWTSGSKLGRWERRSIIGWCEDEVAQCSGRRSSSSTRVASLALDYGCEFNSSLDDCREPSYVQKRLDEIDWMCQWKTR